MVKRLLLLAASVSVLAACGSSGRGSMSPPQAGRLAAESEAVAAKLAAGDGCAAAVLARRLRRDVAAAGLSPAARASAAGLVAEIVCVPPPPVTQAASDAPGEGKKHGEHRAKKKHGKKDD